MARGQGLSSGRPAAGSASLSLGLCRGCGQSGASGGVRSRKGTRRTGRCLPSSRACWMNMPMTELMFRTADGKPSFKPSWPNRPGGEETDQMEMIFG